MNLLKAILIPVFSFFVIRTLIRNVKAESKIKNNSFDLIIALFLSLTAVFFLKIRVFIIFAPALIFYLVAHFKSTRSNVISEAAIEALLDKIILTMQIGMSFQAVCGEISRQEPHWKRLIYISETLDEQKIPPTYGQSSLEREILKIFIFCRKNPSQSFKILASFRKNSRMRRFLSEKQRTMSLQAKAQAIISAGIFIILLTSQYLLNSDFAELLLNLGGRFAVLACTVFVSIGVFLVFNLSKPGELEI